MVDDLTVQGVTEPYRMLTARSEYRLHLRADNAVSRLGAKALKAGVLDEEQLALSLRHLETKVAAQSRLQQKVRGDQLGLADASSRSLAEWARREELVPTIRALLPAGSAAEDALDDAIYQPYLDRQRGEVAARERDRGVSIPSGFDFGSVPGLSLEMRERLAASWPANLDQASRVQGVTPAALSALHFALARNA
jgi:tRNA uridine 5-carboxymethylaminomethyl modification enzyme